MHFKPYFFFQARIRELEDALDGERDTRLRVSTCTDFNVKETRAFFSFDCKISHQHFHSTQIITHNELHVPKVNTKEAPSNFQQKKKSYQTKNITPYNILR